MIEVNQMWLWLAGLVFVVVAGCLLANSVCADSNRRLWREAFDYTKKDRDHWRNQYEILQQKMDAAVREFKEEQTAHNELRRKLQQLLDGERDESDD